MVCVLDDKSVYIGHVHARLDNGGAYKYINLVFYQLRPYVRKSFLGKLTVSHGDARVGDKFGNFCGSTLNCLHTVVNVVDLSAASQLLGYRLNDNAHIMLDNIGLNGISVHRRLLDNAHITNAAHSHIKRSRNRRSRQHKHVHTRKRLLEPLLVSHAEPLLLVNNGKS